MKKYLGIILLIAAIQLNAQDIQRKFDVRFGIGISLLGTGDMTTINFENEINYKINHYFTGSFSLNYGTGNSGLYETSTYFQGNLNIFISPFKNSRRNDFRIGTGLSIMNITDSYFIENFNIESGLTSTYYLDKRNSYGINIIIENTFSITERLLIGLKLFTQPYISNGDINSGILFKLGLKI